MGNSLIKNEIIEKDELTYFKENQSLMENTRSQIIKDYFVSYKLKGNSKDIFNNFIKDISCYEYIINPDSIIIISKTIEIISQENYNLDICNNLFIINNNHFCDSHSNTYHNGILLNNENIFNLFFANNNPKQKREYLVKLLCLEEIYDHVKSKSKLFSLKTFLNETVGIYNEDQNLISSDNNNSCFINFIIRLTSYQIYVYFNKEYEDFLELNEIMENADLNRINDKKADYSNFHFDLNLNCNSDINNFENINKDLSEKENTKKEKLNCLKFDQKSVNFIKAKTLYSKIINCIKQISIWLYNIILDYFALNKRNLIVNLSENIFIKLVDSNLLKIINDLFYIISFEKMEKYKLNLIKFQPNIENIINSNNLNQINEMVMTFNLSYYKNSLTSSYKSLCILKKELKNIDFKMSADNFLVVIILCVLKISNTNIYSESLLLNDVISEETKISEEGYIINTIITANEIIISDIDLNKHLKIEKH